MAVTAWKLGTTASQDGSGASWANITRVTAKAASPGQSTSASVLSIGGSKYIVVSGFDFSDIPDGSTIDGFEVRVNAVNDSGPGDSIIDRVYLRKVAGTNVGNNLGPGLTALTLTFSDRTFGGATALAGVSWSTAELKAAGFQVAVGVSEVSGESSTNCYVESVELRVYYTPAASTATTKQPRLGRWLSFLSSLRGRR